MFTQHKLQTEGNIRSLSLSLSNQIVCEYMRAVCVCILCAHSYTLERFEHNARQPDNPRENQTRSKRHSIMPLVLTMLALLARKQQLLLFRIAWRVPYHDDDDLNVCVCVCVRSSFQPSWEFPRFWRVRAHRYNYMLVRCAMSVFVPVHVFIFGGLGGGA